MDFVLHTSEGPRALSGRFKVEANGTLIVDEPDRGMRTTYAAGAWFKVEQQLPAAPPPQPLAQRIR